MATSSTSTYGKTKEGKKEIERRRKIKEEGFEFEGVRGLPSTRESEVMSSAADKRAIERRKLEEEGEAFPRQLIPSAELVESMKAREQRRAEALTILEQAERAQPSITTPSPEQKAPEQIQTQEVAPQELPAQQAEVQEQQQLIQPKKERIFFPSADEAQQRRLETFGTTSKLPAVGAAAAAAALTFVAAPLVAATIASRIAAIHIGRLLTTKRILTAGGTVGFLKLQLSASEQILNNALTEMGKINDEVKDGDKTYAAAQTEYAVLENDINASENSVKWITNQQLLNYISGGKETLVKYRIARIQTLPDLRNELVEARRIRLLR